MVVWKSLLRIPSGELCTYRQIATTIGKPTAWRAVASAIGNNPVAYLIPCHRVIRSDGHLGGYRWGIGFKQKMLDVEELKKNASPDCK
jgi:O-6-methylguanine DNA methyltransferase